MGVHLNNILSEFVEAIADCMEDKIEVKSGEDLKSRIDRYNEKVEQEWKDKSGQEMAVITEWGSRVNEILRRENVEIFLATTTKVYFHRKVRKVFAWTS